MSNYRYEALKPHHIRAVDVVRSGTERLALHAALSRRPTNALGQVCLPGNLDPVLAISERRLFHHASKYFEAAHAAGRQVFHVTYCPTAFRVARGGLTPETIKRARDYFSRRARVVETRFGRRLLGAIDISFNPDRTGRTDGWWCIHLHALISVEALAPSKARAEIRRAFPRGKSTDGSDSIKPRKTVTIHNEQHLLNVISYASGALVAFDHNPVQRRHRRFRALVDAPGSYTTSDKNLPPELQKELLELMVSVGPKGFWVMSGFRRRGNRIEPEAAFSQNELEEERRRSCQRKAAKKRLETDRGFSHAMEDLRVFSRRALMNQH